MNMYVGWVCVCTVCLAVCCMALVLEGRHWKYLALTLLTLCVFLGIYCLPAVLAVICFVIQKRQWIMPIAKTLTFGTGEILFRTVLKCVDRAYGKLSGQSQ
jgi:hypothetical protein